MIIISGLLPHYGEMDFEGSLYTSLRTQHIPSCKYTIYRYDRKTTGVYWTDAMNELHDMVCESNMLKDSDVICILNADLELAPDLFEKGSKVQFGEILIPQVIENGKVDEWGLAIDWPRKRFYYHFAYIDVFSPRGIFMKVKDFRESGGFNKHLKHYLSDYEWAIRQIKRGIKPVRMDSWVIHQPHSKDAPLFSPLNPHNPWYWIVFLWLTCPKKHLLTNILRAIISAFWRKK